MAALRLPLYQVDAFAPAAFAGNAAAVMPLEEWLPDRLLQALAAENNLSETAFFRPGEGEAFELRWFTPSVEVDLCGHATLAAGFVLMTEIDPALDEVAFESRSGRLGVRRKGRDLFALDFPRHPLRPVAVPEALAAAIGPAPREAFEGPNHLFVYEREAEIAGLAPDMAALAALLAGSGRGVICTAPCAHDGGDVVSRYFAPASGIPEDPATGSAHCMIAPYWAERLGKAHIRALQLSARGGALFCEVKGERVEIAGRAVKYLEGIVTLPG